MTDKLEAAIQHEIENMKHMCDVFTCPNYKMHEDPDFEHFTPNPVYDCDEEIYSLGTVCEFVNSETGEISLRMDLVYEDSL